MHFGDAKSGVLLFEQERLYILKNIGNFVSKIHATI